MRDTTTAICFSHGLRGNSFASIWPIVTGRLMWLASRQSNSASCRVREALLPGAVTVHAVRSMQSSPQNTSRAGYDPFQALTPARIYAWLVPKGLHRGLQRLADLVPLSTRNMSFGFKLRRSLAGLSWPAAYWNPVWLAPADPQTIRDILEAPLSADELYEEPLDLWGGGSGDLLDKTLEFYTNFYLPDDMLTKVDRASMMVSLESRAVFLDNDLVEFCRRLPGRFKLCNGRRKWLLKQALHDWLPEKTINRRKKGFGIPLAKWLRQWPEPVSPNGHGVVHFKAHSFEQRWRRHAQGRTDERLLLFAWLGFMYHGAGAAAWSGRTPIPKAAAGASREVH